MCTTAGLETQRARLAQWLAAELVLEGDCPIRHGSQSREFKQLQSPPTIPPHVLSTADVLDSLSGHEPTPPALGRHLPRVIQGVNFNEGIGVASQDVYNCCSARAGGLLIRSFHSAVANQLMLKIKPDGKIVLRKAVASALFGLTLLSATSASGATITVSTSPDDGRPVINVDGELISADVETFRKIATQNSGLAVVSFSSHGGSLVTGIQIGETIRQRQLNTIIRDGKSCASACALAWLAGAERSIEGTGRIGFHAAYDATSGRETGVGNALLGAYVAKLGLSYNAVIYITKAAPHEMTWLNMSDAAALGIRVAFAGPTTQKPISSLPTRFGNIEIVKCASSDHLGQMQG